MTVGTIVETYFERSETPAPKWYWEMPQSMEASRQKPYNKERRLT
jgi:hypothetical protein